MTIIKQKAVASERHAKNVREYINGKDAVLRDSWNITHPEHWFAEMARTREKFGHDKAARGGKKNTIIWHQVLAFLPEECSCNGGKMSPQACMAYAKQWLQTHYPDQQVQLALHEESDELGKRYAVHMAINRSNLRTHKRLDEGRGRNAAHRRAERVRVMDDEWGLQQVEEGKQNSKIRSRRPSFQRPHDIEGEILERKEHSYKNDVRRLMLEGAFRSRSVVDMDSFTVQMAKWGIAIKVSHGKVYATDLDLVEMHNPKSTYNLSKMDRRFTLQGLESVFQRHRLSAAKQAASSNSSGNGTLIELRSAYMARAEKAWHAYSEQAAASQGLKRSEFPKFKLPKRPETLRNDKELNDQLMSYVLRADKLRQRYSIPNAVQAGRIGAVKAAGAGGSAQARTVQQQGKSHQRQQKHEH